MTAGNVQTHTLPLYLWRLFKPRLKIAHDLGDIDYATFLRLINGLGIIRREGNQIVKEDSKVLEILAQVLNKTIAHPLDKPITVDDIERYFLFHENVHRTVRQELESNPKLLENIIERLSCPDLYPTNGIQRYAQLKEFFANNYGGSYAETGMDRAFIEELRVVLLTEKQMLAGQRVRLVTDIRDPKRNRIYLPPNIEAILEKFTYKETLDWRYLAENEELSGEQLRDIRSKHGQSAVEFIFRVKLSKFFKKRLIHLLLASPRSLNLTQILGLVMLLRNPRLTDKGARLVEDFPSFPGFENLLTRGATAELHNLRGIMGELYVANLLKYQAIPGLKTKVTRLDLPLQSADAKKSFQQFDMLLQRNEDGELRLIEVKKGTKNANNAAEIYKWRVENSRMLDSKLRLEFAEILQELNLNGSIFIDETKVRPGEVIDLVFVIINVVRNPVEERQITRLIKEKILSPLNKKLRADPGLRAKSLQLTSRVVFVPPRALVDEEVSKGRAKIFKEEKQVLTVLKNGINAEIKARQMRFRHLAIKKLNLKAGPATDRIAGILVRLVELEYSGIQTAQAFNRAINELDVKVNGRLREILSNLSVTVSVQEVNQLLSLQQALTDCNTSSLQTTRQVRDQLLLTRLRRAIDFVRNENQIIKLLKESKSGISLDDLLTEVALSPASFNLLLNLHPEWEVKGNVVRIKTMPGTDGEKNQENNAIEDAGSVKSHAKIKQRKRYDVLPKG